MKEEILFLGFPFTGTTILLFNEGLSGRVIMGVIYIISYLIILLRARKKHILSEKLQDIISDFYAEDNARTNRRIQILYRIKSGDVFAWKEYNKQESIDNEWKKSRERLISDLERQIL